MANATTARPRYRVPSIEPEVEVRAVSLDDFDLDDIRAYLRYQGDKIAPLGRPGDIPNSANELFIPPEDLNRIGTLALCGQVESARRYLLDMAAEQIGRPL